MSLILDGRPSRYLQREHSSLKRNSILTSFTHFLFCCFWKKYWKEKNWLCQCLFILFFAKVPIKSFLLLYRYIQFGNFFPLLRNLLTVLQRCDVTRLGSVYICSLDLKKKSLHESKILCFGLHWLCLFDYLWSIGYNHKIYKYFCLNQIFEKNRLDMEVQTIGLLMTHSNSLLYHLLKNAEVLLK